MLQPTLILRLEQADRVGSVLRWRPHAVAAAWDLFAQRFAGFPALPATALFSLQVLVCHSSP
jgi:hypothetical protein